MGTIFEKCALDALKIEVFKNVNTKNFAIKAYKALFTKILPIFCHLILDFGKRYF